MTVIETIKTRKSCRISGRLSPTPSLSGMQRPLRHVFNVIQTLTVGTFGIGLRRTTTRLRPPSLA